MKEKGLGSFLGGYDTNRCPYPSPLNLVIALCLVGGGVIQNLKGAGETVSLPVEPIAVSAEGEILENAEIDVEKRYRHG